MKLASGIHNSGVLNTMVSVRDFLRRFFVANSIQTGGDAPITPTRRRRKFSTRPGIRQRRECAMSRGSPRKYEWGELPMALQARGQSPTGNRGNRRNPAMSGGNWRSSSPEIPPNPSEISPDPPEISPDPPEISPHLLGILISVSLCALAIPPYLPHSGGS